MPDKKLILIPSILAGALIVWVMMFLLPVQRQTGDLRDRLSSLEEKLRNEIPEKQVSMMQTVVDSMRARLDDYNARIFPEERLLDMGRAFEDIGRRYGLKLISITPDYGALSVLSQGSELLSELPMTMTFEGRFAGFSAFMDGMEDFPFLVKVQEAAIAKEEENATTLEIQLRGIVVLRKERSSETVSTEGKAIERT